LKWLAGADPGRIIRFAMDRRQRRASLTLTGELVIETASGRIAPAEGPHVYQERQWTTGFQSMRGISPWPRMGEIPDSARPTMTGRYHSSIDPVLFAAGPRSGSRHRQWAADHGRQYLPYWSDRKPSILPTTVGAVHPAFGGGTLRGPLSIRSGEGLSTSFARMHSSIKA